MTKAGQDLELCLICYPYYPSKDTGRGLDRYTFELTKAIADARPEVKVHLVQQGFSEGVLAAGSKLFRLVADLLSTKGNLYHAISPVGGAVAALMCKAPLVVTIHDLIPFQIKGYDSTWKLWYTRLCTRICVKIGDAVVVPCMVTKAQLISRCKVPESKVHIVNYGVDHAMYYPNPACKRATSQILYVGEVSRSKGVDALIKAFARVKKAVGDAELVIGGKTSRDQPMLEQLARESGMEDSSFLGYIPSKELPRYYTSATVMVFPSRCGFGLSALEAMACGTPVIVGDVLDAPEFIADAGILVNPDDITALAQSIVKVLTEPDWREELSIKGLERARMFSWERMAGETVAVYQEVMRANAGK